MALPRIPRAIPSIWGLHIHTIWRERINARWRGSPLERNCRTPVCYHRREQRAGRESIVMIFMIALSRVFKDRKVMLNKGVASTCSARVCNLRSSFWPELDGWLVTHHFHLKVQPRGKMEFWIIVINETASYIMYMSKTLFLRSQK